MLTTTGFKMTAKDLIRGVLNLSALNGKPFLAVHEMGINEYNQNNIATRLSEMARVTEYNPNPEVVGRYRAGANFKEWALVKSLTAAVPDYQVK